MEQVLQLNYAPDPRMLKMPWMNLMMTVTILQVWPRFCFKQMINVPANDEWSKEEVTRIKEFDEKK